MAAVHYTFYLTALAAEGMAQEEVDQVKVSNCYIYGASTSNTRIERVWRQLLDEVTDKYLSLFTFISHASLYRDWSPVDRIVLLFVFMPLLRAEIVDFVDIKNEYPIRAQKNRVHHVSGVPNKLFDDGKPF